MGLAAMQGTQIAARCGFRANRLMVGGQSCAVSGPTLRPIPTRSAHVCRNSRAPIHSPAAHLTYCMADLFSGKVRTGSVRRIIRIRGVDRTRHIHWRLLKDAIGIVRKCQLSFGPT